MNNQKQDMPVIQEDILRYQKNGQDYQLAVETPAWYTWLSTATSFAYRSEVGTFTARREQAGHKRGSWYWRAYRKRKGRLYQVYVGTAQEVTLERLRTVAATLAVPHMLTAGKPGPKQDILREPPVSQEQARRPVTDAGKRLARNAKAPEPVQQTPAALPLPLTSLIGRECEIAAACTLLAHSEVRLLTLTGTGGIGKTRLALAVASNVQENFPDGVSFISLASVRDSASVLPTLVQALGLQGKNQAPQELLQTALFERHLLLVLDNFEQVVTFQTMQFQLGLFCQGQEVVWAGFRFFCSCR